MHISFVLWVIYQFMTIDFTPIMIALTYKLWCPPYVIYLPVFWSFTLRPNYLLKILYFSLGVKDETSEPYNLTGKVKFCELYSSINVLHSNSERNTFLLNSSKNSPNLIFLFVCYLLAKIRVLATVSTGL
jgi:hypothetical protein